MASERARLWPLLAGLIVVMAACGVDGPPVPPPDEDETPTRAGVQITGSGYAGVARQF
ncbi:MAG: argininosuccinate lyase [Pseudomonadota bacterium]